MSDLTPFEKAAAVYIRESCPRTFLEDLELHARHGYVFITPAYFIMGRPVWSQGEVEEVVNPEFVYGREYQDAWMVYLCATTGTHPLKEFLKLEPYPLPLLCWERDNKLRFYRKARISAKLEYGH